MTIPCLLVEAVDVLTWHEKCWNEDLLSIGLAFIDGGQQQTFPVVDLPSGALAARLR